MHRIRLLGIGWAVALTFAVSAPAVAAPAAQDAEWHRNNYNAGEEVLTCREAAPSWTCTYHVPDATGWFSGRNVTGSWICPGWFPSAICDNVEAVYQGVAVYGPPDGRVSGPTFMVSEDYVLTRVDGQPVLQLYWVDRFVCPWYRTSEEAFAADFNCIFAP
jgi:hypothetical protein